MLPLKHYSNFDVEPSKPIFEDGLLFHIYSDDHCKSSNRYMNEFQVTVDAVHEKDPNVWNMISLHVVKHRTCYQL